MKGLAVPGSLFKNRLPGKTRLGSLKNEHLKQMLIIMRRNTPFKIVIVCVKLFSGLSPKTAFFM